MNSVFAFLGIGHWELLAVAVVILLLFGHRLPSLMRSLGSGINQFKHGLHEDPADVDDHDEVVKEKPKRVVEEKS
jgi:sec-independent protein translocase protein TatA